MAPPPFTTGAAIAAATPEAIPWVIEPLLAGGAITLIDGPPKSAGKTTLSLAMVAAILNGSGFLAAKTVPGQVVYLTEEQRRSFRQGLRRANAESNRLHVLFADRVRRKSFREVVDLVLETVAATGASTVVFDTLAEFAPGIDGTSTKVLDIFAELRRITAAGVAVLAIRHTRKAGGTVGLSGRGSSAATGAADIVVAIDRVKGRPGNVRHLQARSRFDETPEELHVERTGKGYVQVQDPTKLPVDHEEAVLAALPASPDAAITAEAVREGAGMSNTVTRAILGTLVDIGMVKFTGDGVKGDPHRFYRIAA